jgi:hypothetical protein
LTPQGFIGVIDFSHASRGLTRRGRIVAGQVGVVLASEPTPGDLDRLRARTRLDAEYVVGIASWHDRECT